MKLKNSLRIIGVIIFLALLSKIDYSIFLANIKNVNVTLLIFSMLLNFPQLFLKSYRWRFLLKQQGIYYNPIDTFLIYLSSLYFGFLTPGRAGEFVKVIYLKKDHNLSISEGFSSVLLDRLFDLYFLLIVGSYGMYYFDFFSLLNLPIILFVLIILSPLLIFSKYIKNFLILNLFKIFIYKKLKSKIEEGSKLFFNNFHILLNWKLVISVVLTILSYSLFFIQCYLISLSINLSIDFIFVSLSMGIANLVSFLPISISGLGTRDATLIFLFSKIGSNTESIILFSSLVLIIFFVFGGLIGFISFNLRPIDLDKTK